MSYLPQLHRILVEGATRLDAAGEGTPGAGRFAAALGRLRRRRLLIPVSVAILLAGSAAAIAVVENQPSAAPSGRLHRPPGVGTIGPLGVPLSYRIVATPNLNGGSVGWCIMDYVYLSHGTQGGGGCGDVVLSATTIVGADAGSGSSLITSPSEIDPRARSATLTYAKVADVAFVTTPQVAAVRVSPTLTIHTRRDGQLPNGYRIAVWIHESLVHQRVRLHVRHPSLRPVGSPTQVPDPFGAVALDASGHVVGAPFAPHPAFHDPASFWQPKPTRGVGPQPTLHAPPPGACEIDTGALTGVDLFFGSVVQHVHGFSQLAAKTYLSCAETQFAYRGWGVDSAILLDAQHPGARPEPLPDATPVAHEPGVVNEPASDLGSGKALTARRVGERLARHRSRRHTHPTSRRPCVSSAPASTSADRLARRAERFTRTGRALTRIAAAGRRCPG